MLKKLAVSVAVMASVVAGAVVVLDVDGVNKAIADILAPFNTDTTLAKVEFKYLDIADELTQRFGGNVNFAKVGSQNYLTFNITDVDYKYKGDKGIPSLKAGADLNLDLVKAFGQPFLNDVAANAAETVQDFVDQMAEEYGDAVTAEAAVDVLEKDDNGDVSRLKMHLTAKIDLTKLPEGKPLDEVIVTEGTGTLDVSRQSAALTIDLGFNPQYRGFKQDQQGLKEYIQALLDGNKDAYDQIGQLVGWVDQLANDMVERKAGEEKP